MFVVCKHRTSKVNPGTMIAVLLVVLYMSGVSTRAVGAVWTGVTPYRYLCLARVLHRSGGNELILQNCALLVENCRVYLLTAFLLAPSSRNLHQLHWPLTCCNILPCRLIVTHPRRQISNHSNSHLITFIRLWKKLWLYGTAVYA